MDVDLLAPPMLTTVFKGVLKPTQTHCEMGFAKVCNVLWRICDVANPSQAVDHLHMGCRIAKKWSINRPFINAYNHRIWITCYCRRLFTFNMATMLKIQVFEFSWPFSGKNSHTLIDSSGIFVFSDVILVLSPCESEVGMKNFPLVPHMSQLSLF